MAKLKVYGIYDSKVEAYLQPFYARSEGEAMRSWINTCNREDSAMNRNPEDFALFELAEWDDKTARFDQYEVLKPMGTALEAKRASTPQQLSAPSSVKLA